MCVCEREIVFLTEPTCFAQPALWFKYKRSLTNTMIGCKTATHSRRKRKEKKIQARSNTDSKPPETNKGFPDRSLWDQSGITFIFIYLFISKASTERRMCKKKICRTCIFLAKSATSKTTLKNNNNRRHTSSNVLD